MSSSTYLESILDSLEIDSDGVKYGFTCINEMQLKNIDEVIGTFKEDEGLTVIAPIDSLGNIEYEGPFAKLTVKAHTSLGMVGLTAVLASKLTAAGISANVVAAFYHDHIFVQYDLRVDAIKTLTKD